jgi:hypothetical protein
MTNSHGGQYFCAGIRLVAWPARSCHPARQGRANRQWLARYQLRHLRIKPGSLSYAAFTLYHIFEFHERWGSFFKILDHSSIYVLIAGTHTPFALVYLRGHGGWTLFATVWALTLMGILFKVFYVNRFKILAVLFYVIP